MKAENNISFTAESVRKARIYVAWMGYHVEGVDEDDIWMTLP